jgi:phosphoserine phosphatase RsbU/P
MLDCMNPELRKLLSPRFVWARSSGIVRLILYLAGVDGFLFVVQRAFRLLKWTNAAAILNFWLVLLGAVCALLTAFVFLRWLRKKLLWRLRNRLIVTHVFIGVIPVVLLLAMGYVASKLLIGQFASFLVSSDLQHRVELLDSANSALAQTLAVRLQHGSGFESPGGVPPTALFPRRVVTVWYKGTATVLDGSSGSHAVAPVRPLSSNENVAGITDDGGKLYIRASHSMRIGSETLTVISSVPFDNALLHDITAGLGRVALSESANPKGVRKPSDVNQNELRVRSGSRPAPASWFDVPVDFFVPKYFINWQTSEKREGSLFISTRPSLLFDRLFANLGAYANSILMVLGAIAVTLGVIELIALIIGIRLTRTMTRSVHGLYQATQHINQADFTYRIQVKSNDQMAELETSFNSMSDSLERLIADQKEKQRMESELAIAHEVQEQLFPRHGARLSSLEVHGVCRPARTVSGDYYDFLPLGDEMLGIAAGDISGKGISAALLMATIHSAVRVYQMGHVPVSVQEQAAGVGGSSGWLSDHAASLMRAEIMQSPAAVLGLLNGHLFRSTPPEKYATMFLGFWNGHERALRYCNAGHLPPVIFRQHGAVDYLTEGGTVVGLFEEVSFDQASVRLGPGDLVVAYSDGLTEPENEFGEFGQDRLIDLVRGSRNMPLARISELVTNSVLDWIGAAEQPDDMTIVLARAN